MRGEPGEPVLLVGMDTPQVPIELLDRSWNGADAVLGLSEDGGFWAIGLRSGDPAAVFAGIPMSTNRTGAAQLARLTSLGLSVELLPPLRDVDEPADAAYVAEHHPQLTFSRRHAEIVAREGAADVRRAVRRAVCRRPVKVEVGWRRGPSARGQSDQGRSDRVRSDRVLSDRVPTDRCPQAERRKLRGRSDRWTAPADAVDAMVVSRCEPPVIDIGCGPGRMVSALQRSGRAVLGIDISKRAVALAVRGGGQVLRRDLEDDLPGEGRWGTALLLDGNVGIGGDVHGLLARCRELVGPGGLIICETDPDPDRWDRYDLVLPPPAGCLRPDAVGEHRNPFPAADSLRSRSHRRGGVASGRAGVRLPPERGVMPDRAAMVAAAAGGRSQPRSWSRPTSPRSTPWPRTSRGAGTCWC